MSAKVINRNSPAFFGLIGEATPTDEDPTMARELNIRFKDGESAYFLRDEVELIP